MTDMDYAKFFAFGMGLVGILLVYLMFRPAKRVKEEPKPEVKVETRPEVHPAYKDYPPGTAHIYAKDDLFTRAKKIAHACGFTYGPPATTDADSHTRIAHRVYEVLKLYETKDIEADEAEEAEEQE